MKQMQFVQVNKDNDNDCAEFKAIFWDYKDELGEHDPNLLVSPDPQYTMDEFLLKWLNSVIDSQCDSDHHLELCYDGDSLIGFLYGEVDHENPDGFVKPGWGFVREFYVRPAFRRQGYGRAMAERLESLFAADGAKMMYLTPDDITGQPFWAAMGFSETAEIHPDNGEKVWIKEISKCVQLPITPQSSLATRKPLTVPQITYRRLELSDLLPDMLKSFHRYKEVKKSWRKIEGEWVLIDNPYIEDWNDDFRYELITEDFPQAIKSGGALFGAYDDDNLIGFFALDGNLIGSEKQYAWLVYCHVSADYRHHGIGRELFSLVAEAARELGAKKMYISANSSEESQAFYRAVGCVHAEEINPELFELEPYDVHMEFVL
jgi:GNAT superfamily N-acetyltransferase